MTRQNRLIDRLSRQVVLGDGAMGTMLYSQGVFLNRSFEQLNIESPDLVRKVHAGYVSAGVDFIETNTFGANEYRLAKYGLAGDVERINEAAVRIAKEAAGSDVMVAGSMGPLGADLDTRDRVARQEAIRVFRDQASVLAGAGVDFMILETFSHTDEILLAIAVLAEVTDLPIVAQMTADENQETPYGERIDQAIGAIAAQAAVTAVGLNCSTGPSAMLNSLELLRTVTDKPIAVQPNAGLPRRVEDRTLYMCTPEYMAEYAKRFFEKGARIIGGCCGTTPSHIREIVRAVRSMDKATASSQPASVEIVTPGGPGPEKTPSLAEKSTWGAKIAAGEKVCTIELPPPKGIDLSSTIEKAELCARMGVDAINVPDGPRASSRLSPMVAAFQIQQQAHVETLLHVCCRDRNRIGVQSDLLGAAAIGLRNVLIVTGDPPKLGEYPDATGVFDLDSVVLTRVVRDLNRGVDLAGNPIGRGLSLAIGVGANPVAAQMDREIRRFREKVEAGAEFAITQPVFDPASLFRFLDAIEKTRIPVVAGLWPFTSFKNAEFMANEVPGVSVPASLLERMSRARTKQEGLRMGVQIAREMVCQIQDRVQGFAVSAPFGNVRAALAVLGKMDLDSI
jgi:methionine synthase / methylenetetrahydrofolate reductase(NADPH)